MTNLLSAIWFPLRWMATMMATEAKTAKRLRIRVVKTRPLRYVHRDVLHVDKLSTIVDNLLTKTRFLPLRAVFAKRSSLRGRTKVAEVGPPGGVGPSLLKSDRQLTSYVYHTPHPREWRRARGPHPFYHHPQPLSQNTTPQQNPNHLPRTQPRTTRKYSNHHPKIPTPITNSQLLC